jgi:alkylation response protein AidB-like acyl-CoA dehydrogenase
LVELVDHADAARWVTDEAIWKLESGHPARPSPSAHEAKAVASESYYQVCNYSHMVHAGPGTALDHLLVAHTITSRSRYQHLGNPDFHKRRMRDFRFPIGAEPGRS